MNRKIFAGLLMTALMSLSSLIAAPQTALIAVGDASGKLKASELDSLKNLVIAKLSAKKVAVVDWSDKVADKEKKTLPEDTSLISMAKQLKAPLGIKVSVTDLYQKNKTLKATKQINLSGKVNLLTLQTSLKIINIADGSSIYGDVVEASDRLAGSGAVEQFDSGRLSRLYTAVADHLATNLEKKWKDFKAEPVNEKWVEFSVNTNISGVTVKVDGVVLGFAPGKMKAAPGLHRMKFEREWFKPWEGMVNITDGGSIQVTLELSTIGLAKYKSVELLKLDLKRREQELELLKKAGEAEIAIAKEQSEAEAARKKLVAEGRKSFLEKSKVEIKGDIKEVHIEEDDDDDEKDGINQIINIVK